MSNPLHLGIGLALALAPLAARSEEPAPAAAERPWHKAGPDDEVSLNLPVDLAILGGGLVLGGVPELLKSKLAPASCHWCDGPDNSGLPGTGGRADLNAVDASFHDWLTGVIWSRKTHDTLSNLWVGALLPAGALAGSFLVPGPKASRGAGLRNVVLVAQSVAVAFTAVQATKFFAARKRPFVRYGHATDGATEDEGGTYDLNSRDSHISFPSGHTAIATATGVSLAELATLEGSPAAPYLWVGAVAGGAGAAFLRMGAEKHYFIDVSTGFALGLASGIVMPWLHRKGGPLAQADQSVAVVPVSEGAALVWSGSY